MTEGRYLLGVEPPERTARFLERLAGLEVDASWVREAGDRAQETRRVRHRLVQEILPCPPEMEPHLALVRSRPLFGGLFGDHNPSFGLVHLPSLVPVQPHVDMTHALTLVPPHTEGEAALHLCLPATAQPIDVWGGVGEDHGGGAFTVCSPDLNLIVTEVHMDSDPMLKVTFTLSKTAVFLVVLDVNGRLFLKDGTHRAVGLMATGVEFAPCVLLKASDDLVLPGHLPKETCLSDHPPQLSDFLEPELHMVHAWRPGLKVIRIRSDEFVIPRDGGA